MAEPSNVLGRLLRERRVEQQLTQEGLGNRVGLMRQTISEYEQGRVTYPRRETLEKLAGGLDLPVEQLLTAAYLGKVEEHGDERDGPSPGPLQHE